MLGYGGGGLPGGLKWLESSESHALEVRNFEFFFEDVEEGEFVKSLKESDRLESTSRTKYVIKLHYWL